MAFRDGLTHRAAIMRRERGTTDTWLTVDDDAALRMVSLGPVEAQALSQAWSAVITHKAIMAIECDVQDGDRLEVTAVINRNGQYEVPPRKELYDVVAVDRAEGGRRGPHHWRCYLSRIGGVRG
jgi:hypothetical protein